MRNSRSARPAGAASPSLRALPRRAALNLTIITLAQGLYSIVALVLVTVAGIAGQRFAPDATFATVAVAASSVAAAICAIPAANAMARFGRRTALTAANLLGVAGALLSVLGAYASSFALIVAGAALFGALAAFTASYRFAAADAVPDAYKSRAISLSVLSGVVAAFAGPQLARWTLDMTGVPPFVGPYASVGVLCGLGALACLAIRLPAPPPSEGDPAMDRSFLRVLIEPRYAIALAASLFSMALMYLLMIASTLSMVEEQMGVDAMTMGLQWHFVAMYVPSFFSGNLVGRFGAVPLVIAAALILLAAGLVGALFHDVEGYWATLILAGLGWNFATVASGSIASAALPAEQQAKVQGAYNFTVLIAIAVSSFGAGAVLNRFGWETVALLGIALALAWLGLTGALSLAVRRGTARLHAGGGAVAKA